MSGTLHALVPHDRLEILAYANGTGAVVPLSGVVSRRRWGTPGSHWGDLARLLTEQLGDEGTTSLSDLAEEAPGLAWPGLGGQTPGRIASVAVAAMTLGGERTGLLVIGHPGKGLYRPADEAVLATAARVLAGRVASLRLEADLLALRGQVEVLQAPSLPVLRAAEAMASTPHLGEALHRISDEIREMIPHEESKYLLALSDEEVVELTPDSIRPLLDLPLLPLAQSPARAVLENERPWVVSMSHARELLVVPLRVAGRAIGAMLLEASHFPSPREAASVLQQFAAIVAPHLELLRRGALQQRKVRA